MRADPGARSVLVLRPDNLGDLVLFSASLPHLRTLFPHATITLVADSYASELLDGVPGVDRHVEWMSLALWATRVRRIAARSRTLGRLARLVLLHRYRSDVLLLPVRSPSARMHDVVGILPAATKYGIAGDTANQTHAVDAAADDLYTDRLRLREARHLEHELEINREFLRWLGIEVRAEAYRPALAPGAEHQARMERLMARDAGEIVIGLCPSGAQPGWKDYPARAYPEILSRLEGRPIRVVIFGHRDATSACRSVERAITEGATEVTVTNLCGRTSVGELLEGLRRCDAVLSVDAAPMHMAVALGRPTVGIVGGGHPRRFFPWGDRERTRLAEHELDCFDCNWRCPFETRRCIDQIPPQEIANHLRSVLRPSFRERAHT